jgi:hypothetical protein
MPNSFHVSEEDDAEVLFDIISKWFRDVISLAINDCILVLDYSSFRNMYQYPGASSWKICVLALDALHSDCQ